MSKGTDALKEAWRDFVVSGVPATGPNDPDKQEIRDGLDKLALDIAAASVDDPDAIVDLMQPYVDDAEDARDAAEAAASATTSMLADFTETLSEWLVVEQYSYESGYYYTQTGVRTASASYQNAIYNIPENKLLRIVGGYQGSQKLAIYKNAENGGGTVLSYQDLSGIYTEDNPVDLSIPAGAKSVIINSTITYLTQQIVIKARSEVLASDVAERLSSVEVEAGVNKSSIASLTDKLSVWQKTDDLEITPNERYTTSGAPVAQANFSRGFYVINGTERGFRFTGTLLSTDNASEICYFTNADGTGFISREPIPGGALSHYEMTVPPNARSIGFTGRTANEMYLEVLGVPSLSEFSEPSPWSGKVLDVLGDSNVGQNKWQPLVATALGCSFINHGQGGTRVSGSGADAMWQDARIDALDTDADVWIFGPLLTNDWAQNAPIGDITSTSTDEVCGALKVMFSKAVAIAPSKPMFAITPFNTDYDDARDPNWVNGYTNQYGTIFDYAEALRIVAARFSIPVIDVNAIVGWTHRNSSEFLLTEGTGNQSRLHLNTTTGAKRMSDVIVNGLNLNKQLMT